MSRDILQRTLHLETVVEKLILRIRVADTELSQDGLRPLATDWPASVYSEVGAPVYVFIESQAATLKQ